MDKYVNILYQLPNLLTFYRFEGLSSYHYHNFKQANVLDSTSNYIYFSKSKMHHYYYVSQKIKHLINKKILRDLDYDFNKYSIVSLEKYKEIIKRIETFHLEDSLSIEIMTSSLMETLIDKNGLLRYQKERHTCYIERVDEARPGEGGYGFCNEWLEIYQILTYFYAYQRISKNDLLYFADANRYNITHSGNRVNTLEFLEDPNRRKVKINEQLNDSFCKYYLRDRLERILEKKLYLPNSYIGVYQEEAVKEIVQGYCLEKDLVLEVIHNCNKEKIFNKKL